MTLQQILQWCGQNPLTILIGLSALIQISPLKINPWTTLFKWIGTKINGDLTEKLNSVSNDMVALSTQRKEDEKDRIRWEVLSFANSCRNGYNHTKDEYQHIISLNDKYINLLKETNDKNGVFDAEYAYIQKLYKEHQQKNDFL